MPGLSTKKKELYVGTCLDDLHKKSEVKQLGNNVRIIVKSADKVFHDAESHDIQGDEEGAFVLYMRYFNILKYVRSRAEYKKQKEYFDNLIGKKNQLKAIERAEQLAESLKERYDYKEAEAVAKKLAALDASEKDYDIESPEEKPKAKEAEKVPATSIGQIKCMDLCNLLRDSNTRLLMMDVRSVEDFKRSHLSHTDCISVPEEIIRPGSTVNHIQARLPDESKEIWSQRKHADHIILLDWNSTIETVTVGTPLKTLKDALFKFDTSTIIKSEPLVLEGGYEQWLLYYPTMTTNAHVSRPSDSLSARPPSPTISLDFDYPDLDDNLQKKVPPAAAEPSGASLPVVDTFASGSQILMPRFDRSLKPNRSTEPSRNNTPTLSQDSLEGNSSSTNDLPTSSGLYPSIQGDSMLNNLRKDKNINILNDTSKTNGNKSINLSVKNDLDADLQESMDNRKQKESELRDFQVSRDNELKEDQRRIGETQRRLRDLEQMKKKEEKDVADLMRMKKKLNEEIAEQTKQHEDHRQRLADEEKNRVLALEFAKLEEEERKAEVQRLRGERKKQEQEREFSKQKAEEEARRRLEEDEAEERAFEAKMALERQRKEEIKRVTEIEKTKEEQKLREELEAAKLKEKQEEEKKKKEELERLHKANEEEAMLEKEKQERLRQEELKRQEMERQKLERKKKEEAQEKQRQKEKADRERQEQERQRQETLARLAKEKADREREEQERKRQEKERLGVLASKAVTPPSKNVPSTNLPTGWEKRLNRDTNRYFYIDHNRGITQWTPPEMNTPYHGPERYTVKLKDEPSVSSSRGMSRSHSSPDIMKELAAEERARQVVPTVNRGNKPMPNASIKQTAYSLRKRDLNPVYGNVGPALTGLRNLGNTCYMNSTIQCLNNTSPLVTYFLNDNYLDDVNRESSTGMHGEVVDEFAVVIKALWSQQYRSITPRDLKSTVGKYNPMFAGYQQQDSQEFLTFLLDGLHEGLNEVKKPPQIPEQNNDNLLDRDAAAIAWKHHKTLHRSIIVELFQGQLKSTLKCGTCSKKSVTFQAFMFLSLPIPASSRCSLKDCLREFLKPERMTGSSRWKCPKCKVERDSEKKIDIWKLPHILLIGLNRFYSEGMWMQKKTTYVDFPVNDMDLADFVSGPPPRIAYNLYGTSNHYGTMEGGHYTAFCRNPVNKKWFKFDDQDVYEMSMSDVKTSAAFVLYYTASDFNAPQYKPHL